MKATLSPPVSQPQVEIKPVLRETVGPESEKMAVEEARIKDEILVREIQHSIQVMLRLSYEKMRVLQAEMMTQVLKMWQDSWMQRQKVHDENWEKFRKILLA